MVNNSDGNQLCVPLYVMMLVKLILRYEKYPSFVCGFDAILDDRSTAVNLLHEVEYDTMCTGGSYLYAHCLLEQQRNASTSGCRVL